MAYGILVFLSTLYYKFMLFEYQVQDTEGTINHVQIA